LSGIYIHIPFCKQKCTYCDFYTIVAPGKIDAFVHALVNEIGQRNNYLNQSKISTIYFGGGTPSILSEAQLTLIIQSVYAYFNVDTDAEITLEVNPDDLSQDYLQMLSGLPINRLSIGIQSFHDDELKFVNRRHSAQQAIDAYHLARKYGFNNISIDLIYGLPGQDMEKWKYNVHQAIALNPEHISVYGLTFEEGTPLFLQKKKGKVQPAEDDIMIKMHKLMMNELMKNAYDYYEISNYSKEGKRSAHNSSYWNFTPYIGFGPSAHSFDGTSRQWNIASVTQYIDKISKAEVFYEKEILTETNLINEYLLVKLRTKEGISFIDYENRFGTIEKNNLLIKVNNQSFLSYFNVSNESISLNIEGIFLADFIIMNILLDE